ncbi:MAG TPA: PepSY domain-containing protein [Dongiaceae bacterium]|nr:PepSY domain-containing protein [Dongiaceae bacterium]
MMRPLLAVFAAVLLAKAGVAADLRCTDADKSTWLPAAQVQKMLQQHGFTSIGAVQVSAGNCYVVQATDQGGAKKILYLDPTDGALMAVE